MVTGGRIAWYRVHAPQVIHEVGLNDTGFKLQWLQEVESQGTGFILQRLSGVGLHDTEFML